MNKKILFFSILSIVLCFLTSCSDDNEKEIPSDISNVRVETRNGAIMLRWDVPSDSNYYYVQVTFEDPWRNKMRKIHSSVYTDSLLVPGLLNRLGEYKFTLQTFSTTITPGGQLSASGICDPLLPSFSVVSEEGMTLKESNLSTNAQEPTEGPIKNLLDDDAGTHFHSAWSVSVPAPHYLQVDLDQPLANGGFKFKYRTRSSGSGCPEIIDISISADGSNFVKVASFTKEENNLPVGKSVEYTSPVINLLKILDEDYFEPKYIRLNIPKTNSTTNGWFCLSDFWFFNCTIKVYDPENNLEDEPNTI